MATSELGLPSDIPSTSESQSFFGAIADSYFSWTSPSSGDTIEVRTLARGDRASSPYCERDPRPADASLLLDPPSLSSPFILQPRAETDIRSEEAEQLTRRTVTFESTSTSPSTVGSRAYFILIHKKPPSICRPGDQD